MGKCRAKLCISRSECHDPLQRRRAKNCSTSATIELSLRTAAMAMWWHEGFLHSAASLNAGALCFACADQSFARQSESTDACLAEACRGSFQCASFGAVLRDAGDLRASNPLARPRHIREVAGQCGQSRRVWRRFRQPVGAAFVCAIA